MKVKLDPVAIADDEASDRKLRRSFQCDAVFSAVIDAGRLGTDV